MEHSTLARTALIDRHRRLGAKLAPFAGWEMPVEYEGTLAEHAAVREHAGVFDVSHLGTVWIIGDDAVEAVSGAFTNDPYRLADGGSQYTLCATEAGGVTDDLIVYRLRPDRWLTVPNAANAPAVIEQLRRAAPTGVVVDDAAADWSIVAVQGPDSLDLLEDTLGLAPRALDYFHAAETTIAGALGVLCRTGYTGELGAELVVPNAVAGEVFDRLLDAGGVPCGLGARDTLRLEMGYPLHGNDLTPETNPYEARLGWAVKLEHGDFVGRDALRAAKEAGPARRLLGLRSGDRRPLRAGMTVLRDGVPVGVTTSGGFSPTLRVGIALGYLDDPLGPGDEVEVDVRGRPVPVEVLKPPFVDRNPRD